MNIFHEQSPWYATKEAFVLDKREYKEFFAAACKNITYQDADPTIPNFGLEPGVIYEALKTCVRSGLRMSCPELLVTELMVVFDNVVFDFMVRKESGPHHKLLRYFRTEDGKADLQKQMEFVKQLKKNYVHLRRLQTAWEEVMRQVASALVGKWSERFAEEKKRKR